MMDQVLLWAPLVVAVIILLYAGRRDRKRAREQQVAPEKDTTHSTSTPDERDQSR